MFDGVPEEYLKKIAAAQNQLAEAATRLIRLALPEDLRGRAEASYRPFYWDSDDDSPEEYDGVHALIDWGFGKRSDPKPIECKRVLVGYLKEMVENREVLIPGEKPQPHEIAQPGEKSARPWMGLTPEGAQELIDYDNDTEDN
jgi:hypothetical protein